MKDILLVEDHEELNQLMRIFLEKEGYLVEGYCPEKRRWKF